MKDEKTTNELIEQRNKDLETIKKYPKMFHSIPAYRNLPHPLFLNKLWHSSVDSRFLDLSNTGITDIELPYLVEQLHKFQNLKKLNLSDNNISGNNLQNFQLFLSYVASSNIQVVDLTTNVLEPAAIEPLECVIIFFNKDIRTCQYLSINELKKSKNQHDLTIELEQLASPTAEDLDADHTTLFSVIDVNQHYHT